MPWGIQYGRSGPSSDTKCRPAHPHAFARQERPLHRIRRRPPSGTATPLVRPYLTAYEREEKARLQGLRRDTLWLAAYGVDLDTRDIRACLRKAS